MREIDTSKSALLWAYWRRMAGPTTIVGQRRASTLKARSIASAIATRTRLLGCRVRM